MAERVIRISLLNEIKRYFFNLVDLQKTHHPEVSFYPDYVREVEAWALEGLKGHTEIDSETVFLGIWLQNIEDIAYGDPNYTENQTKSILEEKGLPPEKIDAIALCIEAHRSEQKLPFTIEAQVVAAANSATRMVNEKLQGTIPESFAKIRQHYEVVKLIPGIRKELDQLYETWSQLNKAYYKLR